MTFLHRQGDGNNQPGLGAESWSSRHHWTKQTKRGRHSSNRLRYSFKTKPSSKHTRQRTQKLSLNRESILPTKHQLANQELGCGSATTAETKTKSKTKTLLNWWFENRPVIVRLDDKHKDSTKPTNKAQLNRTRKWKPRLGKTQLKTRENYQLNSAKKESKQGTAETRKHGIKSSLTKLNSVLDFEQTTNPTRFTKNRTQNLAKTQLQTQWKKRTQQQETA